MLFFFFFIVVIVFLLVLLQFSKSIRVIGLFFILNISIIVICPFGC